MLYFGYKNRFVASLPPFHRASADFTRSVFTTVAFYLCAKKKSYFKLLFQRRIWEVSTTMKDLCHVVFGIEKEKKDPREVKGSREVDINNMLDSQSSCYKKRKRTEKHAYEEWKTNVLASNNQDKAKGNKSISSLRFI
ncbi:hypothetical protein RJ641_026088 [Dillenia turbinata]|uniref:ORC6 second cyclin-like domain-containing protein n=1 Tax=Dillenia turbinata TaxID=194707 RepID=A0AAN8ZP55_9MAGN